jgi:fucose permease
VEPGSAPAPGLSDTLRHPLVWLNVALFFLYTGIEVVAGQWTYSLFTEARGVSPETAGVWSAGYWGALTLGRLAFGALADRYPAATLLRIGLATAPGAAMLLWLGPGPWLGVAGFLVLGASLAPIYPLLVASTSERLGDADTANAIGFQVAGAYLGAAALPGLAGLLAHSWGLEMIGPFLVSAAVLLALLHEVTGRRSSSALRRRAVAPARG